MKTFDKDNQTKGFQPNRDEVSDFLRGMKLCVFSTLDPSGAPESATVAFSVTKDGELLIGTSQTSHKSHNVDSDNRVAMTVTDEDRRYTVQLKGAAEKLSQADFESGYADEHYRQRPESLPFKDTPGQVHILVRPNYLRFSDCSVYPWLLTEFSS